LAFPVEDFHEALMYGEPDDSELTDGELLSRSSPLNHSPHFEDLADINYQDPKFMGRKSAEAGKHLSFRMEVVPALKAVCQPCNSHCYLGGFCNRHVTCKAILDHRIGFFDDEDEPAPKDKARGERIMGCLRKSRADKNGNLIFHVDGQDVCLVAFLRILGVTTSTDFTKVPGQWQRLVQGFTNAKHKDGDDDDGDDDPLGEKAIHQDHLDEFTVKRGHAKSFISDVVEYYSETLPTVSSDDGSTVAMQVPYSTVKDFFAEYSFHCHAFKTPKNQKASYSTFLRAWNEVYDNGKGEVRLLGSKSGFQTCSICNNCISIKLSACCKRDIPTKTALQKLHRLHILQQGTERQHAENFIEQSRKLADGQPIRGYFDIDPQSSYAGNSPKYSKERVSKDNSVIENRNIGVRIVCGPIDEYISICTDNLIPKGANVLVEVARYCIEYLAERLQAHGMRLPRKIGYQFDNSGENKVSFDLI